MADQWEEAAKQFKPSGTPASAPSTSSNDDWKLWQNNDNSDQRPIGEQPVSPMGLARTMMGQAYEGGKGALKTVGRDAYDLVTSPAAGPIGMGLGYLGDKTGLTGKVQSATETNPNSPAQTTGKYLTRAAEFMAPLPKAAGMLPNVERAGKNFQTVMRAARNVPLDLAKTSEPAIEAHSLGEAGSTVPKVMNKFFQRATAPGSDPITYEQGRRFASNAGRLSTSEALATNQPQMQRQVSALAKALSDANEAAAEQAGVGALYRSAMKEYRQASKLGDAKEAAVRIAKKYAIPAAVGGAAGATGYRIARGLGE